MKNKKVFLIRNIAPDKYGGGETYQIKLGLILKNNGFEPYILTASKGLLRESRSCGIKAIKTPYLRQQNWSGWRNLLLPLYCIELFRLRTWYRRVLRKYKPEVINIQSRDEWLTVTKIAKKMRIRVLWTDHMDFRSWVLQNVGVWYKNVIGKKVLRVARQADYIIMISDYERKYLDDITKKHILNNVLVIKNGVSDKYEEYKNVKVQNNSICYVGRIVDYKGIKELLEAFLAVKQKIPDAILNMFGDEESRYSNNYTKNDGIIFHGRTSEPLKAIAKNEVFVLPSYREGLSLSLLDAAMMKKRIIASDVDGNPEVIINNKTGLLVPVKNVDKLAEAMIYMLENKKDAEKMAENARKYYEKNFDFDKIFMKKMMPLYNVKKEEE